jgi:predicted metal-binding membrane protein
MNSTTVSLPPRARRRRRIVFAVVGLIAAVIVAFAVQQSIAAASAAVPPGQSTETGEAMPNDVIDGSVVAPSEADGVIRDRVRRGQGRGLEARP